jgi:acyl-CoA synthetase (AMP-forming)/AMP-acid ligase II/alkylation response protein AidB-like acyl-CoA dehydrogenase/acyl carrier protein
VSLEKNVKQDFTIVSCLKSHLEKTPNDNAFQYLPANSGSSISMSWKELDLAANAIGAILKIAAENSQSNAAVLIFPSGLDFVQSYFGTLYAGLAAVPIRMPKPNQPIDHVNSVLKICGAKVILTTKEMSIRLKPLCPGVQVIAIADITRDTETDFAAYQPSFDDVAHLQFTSGSTSAPKGVMVTHRNIIENSEDLAKHWCVLPTSRPLSWLPHYHDLGLIFGCIQPVFMGCKGFLMNPSGFAQRPISWLQALTDHKITHTAAPNFAFQTCANIKPELLVGLNLSSLEVATNGAEPIRADTIKAFTDAFSPYGFDPIAMCPGYGLAEVTLMASFCGPDRLPPVLNADPIALREGQLIEATVGEDARALVSSSGYETRTDILIVDPVTHKAVPKGSTGEVWLKGGSVSPGYLNRPDLNADKFDVSLSDDLNKTYLRTGDLGGFYASQLYVLGRIDDLIIIRGVNHGAEDIELTMENAHSALTAGGGAAFTIDLAGESRLIVAHEVDRATMRKIATQDDCADEIYRSIRSSIFETHEIEVAALVLLPLKGLPKTPTGKKKRHGCCAEFLAGSLRGIATWHVPKLADTFHKTVQAPRNLSVKRASVSSRPDQAEQTGQFEGNTDKVKALVGWLQDFGNKRLNSRVMDERRTIPPYVVLELGNRGVLGMLAPEKHGGLGLNNQEFARSVQQLAAIDTTVASFTLVNNALGLRPIMRFATEENKEELMPSLGAGRQLASFAMTEANAGSNIRNLSSIGQPTDRNGWQLWGQKLWSGTASWAGVVNTFVQQQSSSGQPEGVSGFVIRQGQEGWRNGPESLTMGLRAMVQNEIHLEGVHVTKRDRLGELGQGMVPAMDAMDYGRFAIGALSIGIIKRCIQLMARHGDRRVISTGRLLENPSTLMRISDLAAAASAIEAVIEVVSNGLDRGVTIPAEMFCLCKTAGPEFAWRAADGLIQQLAGRGFVETNIAPQILRDTRVLRIFEGPTEPLNMHIGSCVVHRPRDLIDFVTNTLGQADLAVEIETMGTKIWEHWQSGSSSLSNQATKQWGYIEIGETIGYALMLGCIRHRMRFEANDALKRAEAWAQLRYERRAAKALGATAAHAAFLQAKQVEVLVEGYKGFIGDIEQTLPGEDHALTPVLAVSPVQARPVAPEIKIGSSADLGSSEVTTWLKSWLAKQFETTTEIYKLDSKFSEFGMDSITAMNLADDLERWLSVEIPPTLVWEYPTLGSMSSYLMSLGSAVLKANTEIPGLNLDISILARVDDMPEDELLALLETYSNAETS